MGENNNLSAIINSYAQGNVSGRVRYTGGLVGYNYSSSTITNCYAQGSVSGKQSTGGLVGDNTSAVISNSYAKGTVSGTGISTGGLAGENYSGSITNSYAQGSVSGTDYTGGLVGINNASGTITNSYAQGTVSGNTATGGLAGSNHSSTITNSIWDKQKSGLDTGIGQNDQSDPAKASVTGLTTSEMANPQNFIDAGWDASVWDLTSTPPRLAWQPKDVKGNLRLQIGANADEASAIYADTAFEIGAFAVDFSNEEASRASIDTVDELLEKINKKISEFGAVLNRLDSVLTSQTTSIENLTAARSTIQDADIAEESAIFVRNQILQQTTSSLLVQAQRSQSSVLRALIRK